MFVIETPLWVWLFVGVAMVPAILGVAATLLWNAKRPRAAGSLRRGDLYLELWGGDWYRVPKADGFFPLYLKAERAVRLSLYGFGDRYPERLADFLSLSHVTAPGKLFEWTQRSTALPMATAGQSPIFATPEATLKAMVDPAFAPLKGNPRFDRLVTGQ